jgi:hypothetical protein
MQAILAGQRRCMSPLPVNHENSIKWYKRNTSISGSLA